MMIPRRARLSGFFNLPDCEVIYPEQGVLTVTGNNGRGKSARYLEALAWAGWGETLRGTPPGTCTVELETDKVFIRRAPKAPKLTWNYHGSKPMEFETPTKANAALENVLGSFYSWHRSSVFSSSDAALFSQGTDGDRKKLLVKLIGADVFDSAMELVKAAVADLVAKEGALVEELNTIAARIAETRHAVESFASLVGLEPPSEDIASLQARQSALVVRRRQLSGDYTRAMSEVNVLQGKLMAFQRSFSYVSNGCCMTCGQSIPVDTVRSHQAEVEALSAEVEAAREAADKIRSEVHAEVHQVEMDLAAIQDQIATASRYNPDAALKLAELRERGQDLVAQWKSVQARKAFYDDELEVFRLTGMVLGPRGFRSMLLASALSELEALANSYLDWLAVGVRIEIKGHTLTVKGTTQEKIDLIVHGLGGGHGYKALSAGERRRIDLVLLLALASLARSRGTLLFDEAFDNLDQHGIDAAACLIEKLAETKPLVVISHNALLISKLSKVGQVVCV